MAKNEPNKPDDGKTMPANETPKEQTAPVSAPLAADKQAEAPEVAADKAATLPGPGTAARTEGGPPLRRTGTNCIYQSFRTSPI